MKLLRLLLVLGILAPSAGTAANLHYDFAQLDYMQVKPDDADIDIDGFSVSFSHLLGSRVFFQGGYDRVETEEFPLTNGSYQSTEWTAGLGLRGPMKPGTDVVAAASFVSSASKGKGDFAGDDDDDTGYLRELGIRTLLTDALELQLGAGRLDLYDDPTNFARLNAIVHLSAAVGLHAGADLESDGKIYRFGVRFDF